MKKASAKSFF